MKNKDTLNIPSMKIHYAGTALELVKFCNEQLIQKDQIVQIINQKDGGFIILYY